MYVAGHAQSDATTAHHLPKLLETVPLTRGQPRSPSVTNSLWSTLWQVLCEGELYGPHTMHVHLMHQQGLKLQCLDIGKQVHTYDAKIISCSDDIIVLNAPSPRPHTCTIKPTSLVPMQADFFNIEDEVKNTYTGWHYFIDNSSCMGTWLQLDTHNTVYSLTHPHIYDLS